MSKNPLFPNKFAILASILGVWESMKVGADHPVVYGMYYNTDAADAYHPYVLYLGYAEFAFPAFNNTTIMARVKNSDGTWQAWKTISMT